MLLEAVYGDYDQSIQTIEQTNKQSFLQSVFLYFRLIAISIRSQMQYRSSFFMLVSAHFISTFVDILGIWVLFDRFKVVQGWTLEELALIYGVMHMGFAAAEISARGFDQFSQIIKNGDFDRLLLRPCETLFQVAARDFQLMRIGRFLQGLVVLIWSGAELEIEFLSVRGLLLFLSFLEPVQYLRSGDLCAHFTYKPLKIFSHIN